MGQIHIFSPDQIVFGVLNYLHLVQESKFRNEAAIMTALVHFISGWCHSGCQKWVEDKLPMDGPPLGVHLFDKPHDRRGAYWEAFLNMRSDVTCPDSEVIGFLVQVD